jgi:hypothetical protein
METNNIINAQSAYELLVENAFTISQVNEILRNAINSSDNQYTQLKWNKFEKKFVTRSFFTTSYLEKFELISDYLQKQLRFPGTRTIGKFFIEPVNEQYTTTRIKWGGKYTDEEYDEFVKQKLHWGVITIRFPKKNFTYPNHLVDINYFFDYSYFENGEGGYDHAFIEHSSDEDTFEAFYNPYFHRAYVSLKGQVYPFFKHPICECVSKSRDLFMNDKVSFNVIKYLNKDLGMFALADRLKASYYKEEPLSNKSAEYYEDNYWSRLKKEYYTFTLAEARQLNPHWQEDDDDYYSDY